MSHMVYFQQVVRACEALAFRALPDGTITAGVGQEIEWARGACVPVIELLGFALRKVLDVNQTKEYLAEAGQR